MNGGAFRAENLDFIGVKLRVRVTTEFVDCVIVKSHSTLAGTLGYKARERGKEKAWLPGGEGVCEGMGAVVAVRDRSTEGGIQDRRHHIREYSSRAQSTNYRCLGLPYSPANQTPWVIYRTQTTLNAEPGCEQAIPEILLAFVYLGEQ